MLSHPLAAVQETHWFNFYKKTSAKDNAPYLTVELKNKATGGISRYPLWQDQNHPDRLYLGKPEGDSRVKEQCDE